MKRVVVTGASRGIGRATAEEFANRGCALELLGRESPALREVEGALRVGGATVEVVPCELADRESVASAARSVLSRGAPDVLVHAAGIIERASVDSMSDEIWDRQMEVNVHAPFRLTRALLPAMLARNSGRVLFVSSISAVLGSPRQAAYNASKAALNALMRCLAEELSETPLMTACVAPGAVETDMLKGSPYPPRMSAAEVASALVYLGLAGSHGHNGSVLEMFGT